MTDESTRADLVAELDSLYSRYGWSNDATDTWWAYARGWDDTDRIRGEVEQLRSMVQYYEAAEASAR